MENMQKNIKVIWWIKSLLASYIVTGILLLVLTFFMYKFELNEKIVSAAIVGIYVVSTLIGGMIIGKLTKSKRYLWGMVLGIIYFVLISRMDDIQRTFMYHGAEHKCINCIEHGLPLTVDNVRISSRQHKRCGTSFLFFVLAISIILLMLIQVESPLMRVIVRIALIPVIAGISYEVLKLAGRSENPIINLLSRPGLAIQKLTTKEPDDSMIEVAIQAVEAVFDWRAYEAENFKTAEDL